MQLSLMLAHFFIKSLQAMSYISSHLCCYFGYFKKDIYIFRNEEKSMMAAQLFQALPPLWNSSLCHKLSQGVDFTIFLRSAQTAHISRIYFLLLLNLEVLEPREAVCLVICYLLFENWRGFWGIIFLKDKTKLFYLATEPWRRLETFKMFVDYPRPSLFTKIVG